MITNKLHKIVVDDGYAQTKVAYFAKDGSIKATQITSSYTDANLGGEVSVTGETVNTYCTPARGRTDMDIPARFCVTENVNSGDGNTRTEGYSTSPQNRCVIHHAIHESGVAHESHGDIHLSVTLPIKPFYSRDRDRIIRERKESLILPVYQERGVTDRVKVNNIERVSVLPEAIMAYCDYLMDDNGQCVADPEETIAVIDVGGRTTDVALIHPKMNIDRSRSDSIDLGVLKYFDKVRDLIAVDGGIRINNRLIDQAIKNNGQVRIQGQMTDLSGYLNNASEILVRELKERISGVISHYDDVDRLLYVGGGAIVLGNTLSKHPNVIVPNEPQFANARGALKFITYRAS